MRTRIWNLVGICPAGLALSMTATACNVFGDFLAPSGSDASMAEGGHGEGGSSGGVDSSVDGNSGDGPRIDARMDGAIDSGDDSGNVGVPDGSTAPWWPYTTEAGCMSAGMPTQADRPATSDSDAGDLPPIYLAFSHLSEGSAVYSFPMMPEMVTSDMNAWKDIGFDIDGRCTNSATCPAARGMNAEYGCVNASMVVPFDGNLCRDNQIGKLYQIGSTAPDLSVFFGFTEQDTNCELRRGGDGAILKISQYNGALNDPQVRLDMYSSLGLVKPPFWKCRANPSAPSVDPTWPTEAIWLKGPDHWIVAQQSISLAATITGPDLPDSNNADSLAYVRNGYLVAQMSEGAPFWFPGDNTPIRRLRIPMHHGVLVAKLEKAPDDTWVVNDGTLAFIALPNQLLQAFREIGYCENMCAQYGVVKAYINTNQDTLSNAYSGSTVTWFPNTPCDSLSAGFAFRAMEATALSSDIKPAIDPVICPDPINPTAPKQGCDCDGGPNFCGAEAGAPPMDSGGDARDASGGDAGGGG
jgi:hypothetical protein